MGENEIKSKEICFSNIFYVIILLILLGVLRFLFPQSSEPENRIIPQLFSTIWSEFDMHDSIIGFAESLASYNEVAAGIFIVTQFQYVFLSMNINLLLKSDGIVEKLLNFLGNCLLQMVLAFMYSVCTEEMKCSMLLIITAVYGICIVAPVIIFHILIFIPGIDIGFDPYESPSMKAYFIIIIALCLDAVVYVLAIYAGIYFNLPKTAMMVISFILTYILGKSNEVVYAVQEEEEDGLSTNVFALIFIAFTFVLWFIAAVLGIDIPNLISWLQSLEAFQ